MTLPAELRADLAQVIADALRADGWLAVRPGACLAVADALIARPGLLREILNPSPPGQLILDETGIPLGRAGG